MRTHAEKLRDQAAGPILERVKADAGRVSRKLKALLETIEVRLFSPGLDLTSLCRESGISKWLANRQLAKELSTTPWAYVTDRRMMVAAELLGHTQLRVYQIAEVLGYPASRDTFSEVFERWSGQTPTAYRKAPGISADGRHGRRPEPGCEAAAEAGLQQLSARLALACHQRAAQRIWSGDVDGAFADLNLARQCYAMAGELPPRIRRQRRYIPVAVDTDEALRSNLCAECRAHLESDRGGTLRRHLSCSLEPIPADLWWFEVCCGPCCRVVRQAISQARSRHMDDAWKAWWLSVNLDP